MSDPELDDFVALVLTIVFGLATGAVLAWLGLLWFLTFL